MPTCGPLAYAFVNHGLVIGIGHKRAQAWSHKCVVTSKCVLAGGPRGSHPGLWLIRAWHYWTFRQVRVYGNTPRCRSPILPALTGERVFTRRLSEPPCVCVLHNFRPLSAAWTSCLNLCVCQSWSSGGTRSSGSIKAMTTIS